MFSNRESAKDDAEMTSPTAPAVPTPEVPPREEDNAPLFYQPGHSGFYSPRPGNNSPERLNVFRNIGR